MKNTIRMTAIAAALMQAGAGLTAELEEVVVTAQFREVSLQDAGLAIDAYDGDRLVREGVTSANDVASLVPALTIVTGAGLSSQLYMRGIGNRANNNYLDPAIILTYDGVPIARGSAAALGGFYDLQRVEVLKGPQGTLYGKNATGGVMNVISKRPVIGETEGFINGEFGNYDLVNVTGAINVSVGDNSALRVSGGTVERDGYNDDGTNDEGKDSVRVQFLTEPSEDLSIRVGFDYTDIDQVGPGGDPIGRYVRNGPPVLGQGFGNWRFVQDGVKPGTGMSSAEGNAYRNTVLSAPGFGFLSDVQDEWYTDAEMMGFSAEINYQTEAGLLTFIPAWRSTEQDSKFNGPGFNSGWWQTDTEQTTVELRFSGDIGGRVDYVVGGFYFDETAEGNNTFNQEFVLPLQEYTQDYESWAVFAELTWSLGENTRLITGARYTDDKKDMQGGINNFITFCGGIGPRLITPPGSFAQGCAVPGNLPRYPTLDTPEQAKAFLVDNDWAAAFIPIPPGELIPLKNGVGQILHAISENNSNYEEDEVTYRIALEQDLGEDTLVYLAFETGYRAGGLLPQSEARYEPEFLDAWTIGTKSRFLDGRLQLNTEFFYWEYEDQQISYFNLNEDGVLQNTTDNVGESTNKGFDVDVMFLATENTLLSAKVQYLDAEYEDLHFNTTVPRDNINCPFTVYEINEEGDPLADFDCSGNQSIYSPEWTYIFGIEQTIPLAGMNLVLSVNSRWTDDQVTGFTNLEHEVIESHWLTNADVTLVSADNSWSISAWARNLEDKRRLQQTQAPLLGMAVGQYGADMTYGVRLGYNF